MSMRDFAPFWLPDERVPRERMSATFGRAYNVCPRSAALYQLHRGGASTHPLERGSALHRVLELGTLAMVDQGEGKLPPEIVKAIVNEVLADPAYRVPIEEHDYIRESAYRWAEETEIVPDELVAVETLIVLDVDGFSVRMKIDRAELHDGGSVCEVLDYKSSRSLPAYEDLGRRRPDGSIAAKSYQLVLYALGLAFGVPVRVETGPGGERVEIPEPFGLAERAQAFDLAFLYPGVEGKDGRMARRELSLTRLELHEYMDSLRAQVAQVRHSVAEGDWPASSGGHCTECACPAQCPIPPELRKHAGEINTMEQAAEAAEQLSREKAEHAARRKELVAFVKSRPVGQQRLRYGRDQVLEVGYQERTEIKDRDGMFAAMERAVRYGEPFDREEWVRRSNSTPIVDRRLTEDELALEARGNDEEEGVADAA